MDFILGLPESSWKTREKDQEKERGNERGKGRGQLYNAILDVVV
jgi:hypothetical protein